MQPFHDYPAETCARAVSIDGLANAEVAFNQKVKSDGTPIGISPAILLVPSALGVTGTALMNSLEICANGPDAYPTSNPHTGKFRLVKSTWLNTPTVPNGDPQTWYLLADPSDLTTIEVAFLNGQEQPTIESADADFNILGVQMRGFHDFGVRKQDARGAIKLLGK